MSDQPVAETGTYTTHSKHNSRKFISSAGFELVTPIIQRLKIYAIDRKATGINFSVTV
jgi:hypothetical protein